MVRLTRGAAGCTCGVSLTNVTMIELPPRQLEALQAIAGFIADKNYAPTRREIAEVMGLSSLNGINQHLTALERKGMIGREPKSARALWLTDSGRELIAAPVATTTEEGNA